MKAYDLERRYSKSKYLVYTYVAQGMCSRSQRVTDGRSCNGISVYSTSLTTATSSKVWDYEAQMQREPGLDHVCTPLTSKAFPISRCPVTVAFPSISKSDVPSLMAPKI